MVEAHEQNGAEAPSTSSSAVVHHLPFSGDDRALVQAIRAGHRGARRELFDRYAKQVERVLVRVLGPDDEIADLIQEVFIAALQQIDSLVDEAALKGWLSGIAVYQARGCIRRRTRRRWLKLVPDGELPEVADHSAPPEVSEALKSTYEVLDRMPADERIPFALRFIDGMELTEVAAACNVSLATIKRRLSRAQARFGKLASRHPALREWVDRSDRWSAS